MRVVLYARYSSDNQTENSIEGQLRECKNFCERNGMTVIKSYIDPPSRRSSTGGPTYTRPKGEHRLFSRRVRRNGVVLRVARGSCGFFTTWPPFEDGIMNCAGPQNYNHTPRLNFGELIFG